MILLPSYIHILYFGIGASALATNLNGPATSTSSPAHQTPTAISRKHDLQDPTFTLHSQISTDDYSHVALQSASNIARPSRAVTSLATGLSGVHIEPQSYSSNGSLPSAPTSGLRSQGSTGLPFYYAGVLSSHLPGGTTEPRPPVTTFATTNSTTGLSHIIVAVDQAALEIEQLATLLSGSTKTMSGSRPQEQPENALSVLLSALPTDVASSIEAGFSVVTHDLLATSNAETARPTSLSPPSKSVDQITTSTSRPDRRPTSSEESERPTSRYTARPISDISLASQSTRRPGNSHISSSNTSRPTTLATRPSTTPAPTPSTTSTSTPSTIPMSTPTSDSSNNTPPTAQDSKASPPPSITPEKQNTNGTIAGIATGSVAALVLISLIVFFLLRRRRKQKALKAQAAQNNQPYPEVAFLYDPVQSPPGSVSPAPPSGEADNRLGVGGAGGVVGSRRESAMSQAQRSSLLAPEVVVVPEGEHLLAPGRAASRESSPNGMGRGRYN